MGDRDPGVGGGGDAGGDAGDDLEGDARRRQRLGLLAAAAEDERVAALEPDDDLPLPRALDQQLRSISSWGTLAVARFLADVEQLGVRRAPRPVRRAGISRSWRITSAATISSRLRRSSGRGRRGRPRPGRRSPARRSRGRPPSARFRISPAPADCIRSASSRPSASGSLASASTSSRIHSLPSGRPQKPAQCHPPVVDHGVDADRRVAARLQPATTARSAVSPARASRSVIVCASDCDGLLVGAGLERQRALARRRGHLLGSSSKRDLVRAAEPPQAGGREHHAVEVPVGELAEPGVDVAAQLLDLAGRAAGRGAASGGAGWRCRSGRPPADRLERVGLADEGVAGVLASGTPAISSPRELAGQVLGRVHAEVDLRRRAAPARSRGRSGPCPRRPVRGRPSS